MTQVHATLTALCIPIDSVRPYGRNARQGDVGAIVTSLERHGQYRPIVVNAPTQEILAGNHTWLAARELGWREIAATFVDVDDDTAARIVLVDNRSNDLAGYDDHALSELLSELAAGDDGLSGTGFDGDDLDQLLRDLAPPDLDGESGEHEDAAAAAAVKLSLGEYQFELPRKAYDDWIESVRSLAGEVREDVIDELRARLGVPAP